MALTVPRLYAITDRQWLPGDRLFSGVQAALAGGCGWVQYRDKTQSVPQRYAEAARLLQLCRDAGAKLLINDDLALALALEADGLHLGREDMPLAEARQRLGSGMILGATCHGNLAWAEESWRAGADYLAFGRFFPSGTKPLASAAAVSVLADAQRWGLPRVAIGGITLSNAAILLQAGADCLAVSQGLFAAADIAAQARAFLALTPSQGAVQS
jgi:thiamine-phosphate pyrophosphorylase